MTALDPWHERPCEGCLQPFKPAGKYKQLAAKQRFCSGSCSAKYAVSKRHNSGRPPGSAIKALDPIDETPCTRCGLRGHLAGDPVKCYEGSELMHRRGLGVQGWV